MANHHRGLLLLATCGMVAALLMPAAGAVNERGVPERPHHAVAPDVTKVSPASGAAKGGTVVTIKGHRFTKVKKVLFGRARATGLTRVSSKKLRVTAPAHASGRVDVRVVTRNGRSRKVSADRFTYRATGSAAPMVGSYSGRDGQGRALTFYVSPGRHSLQDISVPLVDLNCVPAGVVDDKIQIASIAINGDGSFASTTTQTGVLAGHPVAFSYVFRGHVNSSTSLSGTLRETVSNTDSPARVCTSNDQSWSANRDTQPAQPTSAPPSGAYTGKDTQGRALTFTVGAGGSSLQDVTVPLVDLSCVPAGVVDDKIQIDSLSVGADGSFNSVSQQTGVLGGHPVTLTYVFRGHVHGVGPTGVWRLAGQLRETLSNTDATPRSCTSNDQAWYAQHS